MTYRFRFALFHWTATVFFLVHFATVSLVYSQTSISHPKITSGTLGEGTWSTDWKIVESGNPGPTVLVVGGVHGNEPAGFRAATQIQNWPITKGKLVVLPCVNRLGIAANMRWFPEHRNDRSLRDLNRNFPTVERPGPQTRLGKAVWEFVKQQKPDWVFDLHEGFDFHRVNNKSVGSSVIAFPVNTGFASSLQRAVNADIRDNRQFDLLTQSGPASGSLARACEEQLGARSFILETTFKDQSLSKRARQHRTMMSVALRKIGIIDRECVDHLSPLHLSQQIRVAVFDGAGANPDALMRLFDKHSRDVFACHVGPPDLNPEALKSFDVVIFPGGSGSKQGRDIGPSGREAIRTYVDGGGGLIGVCAGAYLCTSHYDWSLDLMNAAVFNRMVEIPKVGKKSMWFRGPAANVKIEFTEPGREVFATSGIKSIRYQNGPILSPGNKPTSPTYKTLAIYRSEVGIYDAQKNTMVNSPAIVESKFGKGKVIAIGPHFESTPNEESIVLRAIKHVRFQREKIGD